VAAYFLDSSALVKRYIDEIGSNWIRSLTSAPAGNTVHVVALAAVEVTSAVVRRGRGGAIAANDVRLALSRLDSDLVTLYRVFEGGQPLVKGARQMAEIHGLRAYDAVQLAAALEVQARASTIGLRIAFISSDAELNSAAARSGLLVDDPQNHP
jgi:predicted nucleic acid-binding protein